MQMRGCRNQNIWGDNKVAGAASCQRPPSHCRTVGEHHRGQPQQPRAPPSAGSTAPVWVMHPPRSIPGELRLSPTPPQRWHRPAARTGSPGTRRMPWGSPSGDYTGFSHPLFHPAHQGGPGVVRSPPSPPTAGDGGSPAAGCGMQGCSRDRSGASRVQTWGTEPSKKTQGEAIGSPQLCPGPSQPPPSTTRVSGTHQSSPTTAVQGGEEDT